MGAAWTLLSTNIQRVAKALWIPALAVAVLTAVATPMSMKINTLRAMGTVTLADMGSIVCIALMALAAQLNLYAKVMQLVNSQATAFCVKRSIKSFAILLTAVILCSLATVGLGYLAMKAVRMQNMAPLTTYTLMMVTVLVIFIALMMLLSPLYYAITKYMVEPETKVRHLWKNFRVGFRSIGYIITFVLLSSIIIGIIYLITSLSSLIILFAFNYSLAGVMMGDPAGLPEGFSILAGVTSFLGSFIYIILSVWFAFATYYIYCSIEAKNGRKDEENNQ